MAQNDLITRYIDAIADFSELTQRRAEALVKELVKAGEVQADQAREAVTELLDRSRRNSERLLETIRTEVRSQITALGLASQADLDRFEERIASMVGTATAPGKQAAATTKQAVARTVEKAAGKKVARQKAPATKKAAAKRSGAAKKPAKRSGAAKKPAKKSPKKG